MPKKILWIVINHSNGKNSHAMEKKRMQQSIAIDGGDLSGRSTIKLMKLKFQTP